VVAGQTAPINGLFTATDGSKVDYIANRGDVAQSAGRFCVDEPTVSLLQRAFSVSDVSEFDVLLRKKSASSTEATGTTESSVAGKTATTATEAPATEAPATEAPATEAPATDPPATEPPNPIVHVPIRPATEPPAPTCNLNRIATMNQCVMPSAGAGGCSVMQAYLACVTQSPCYAVKFKDLPGNMASGVAMVDDVSQRDTVCQSITSLAMILPGCSLDCGGEPGAPSGAPPGVPGAPPGFPAFEPPAGFPAFAPPAGFPR